MVAFLLVVILTNLLKGYRIHKPRNAPFSLAEFSLYSKNRTSEFFGVTRNIYFTFGILATLTSIVALNYFWETKGKRAAVVIDETREKAIEVKADVAAGFEDMQIQQVEILDRLRNVENQKEEVIDEVHALGDRLTGSRPRATTRTPATTSSTVQIIEAKPLKIAPTTPLSDDDIIVEEKRNDSLYIGERQSTTIQPSSLE